MADKIHFQIATADGVVCDSMVCYALVPLSDGDVGVLSDHAPMIGALKEGVVKYVSEGEDHFAAISGGVLSVADNEVILLARTAERAETIDLARAQASERFISKQKSRRQAAFSCLKNPTFRSERGILILFGSQGDDGILVCRNAGWDKSGNDSQQHADRNQRNGCKRRQHGVY